LDRTDCLILIGDTMHPPGLEARDWIEEWLSKKSGRKVIYFGRDFDAAEFYMRQTLPSQPAASRIRAGLDLAEIRAQRDDVLFEQMNSDHFCRWFYVRVGKPERVVEKFSGPWSEKLSGHMQWPVRAFLDVPDPELRDEVPAWSAAPTNFSPWRLPKRFRNGRAAPTAPRTPANKQNQNTTVFNSTWEPGEVNDKDKWDAEWDVAPDVEPLLVADDGTPLIMKLTSERYPGSQIITLANGAPLFNGMMVNEDLRKLCLRLANEIEENARVTYLPYGQDGIQVSFIPDIENEITGLSVLMTWPPDLDFAVSIDQIAERNDSFLLSYLDFRQKSIALDGV
jgi:hypothetical protein